MEVGSSAVQSNTLPPRARGATSKPDLPSFRLCMVGDSFRDSILDDATTLLAPESANRLQRPPSTGSRGPCPLEVEASQVPGDVDDFANEIEAWNLAALHVFC